jgi:hypothetical protein
MKSVLNLSVLVSLILSQNAFAWETLLCKVVKETSESSEIEQIVTTASRTVDHGRPIFSRQETDTVFLSAAVGPAYQPVRYSSLVLTDKVTGLTAIAKGLLGKNIYVETTLVKANGGLLGDSDITALTLKCNILSD